MNELKVQLARSKADYLGRELELQGSKDENSHLVNQRSNLKEGPSREAEVRSELITKLEQERKTHGYKADIIAELKRDEEKLKREKSATETELSSKIESLEIIVREKDQSLISLQKQYKTETSRNRFSVEQERKTLKGQYSKELDELKVTNTVLEGRVIGVLKKSSEFKTTVKNLNSEIKHLKEKLSAISRLDTPTNYQYTVQKKKSIWNIANFWAIFLGGYTNQQQPSSSYVHTHQSVFNQSDQQHEPQQALFINTHHHHHQQQQYKYQAQGHGRLQYAKYPQQTPQQQIAQQYPQYHKQQQAQQYPQGISQKHLHPQPQQGPIEIIDLDVEELSSSPSAESVQLIEIEESPLLIVNPDLTPLSIGITSRNENSNTNPDFSSNHEHDNTTELVPNKRSHPEEPDEIITKKPRTTVRHVNLSPEVEGEENIPLIPSELLENISHKTDLSGIAEATEKNVPARLKERINDLMGFFSILRIYPKRKQM